MTDTELIEKVEVIASYISKARTEGKSIAYLSGKVTGLNSIVVDQKFKHDANRLRAANWFVFNPPEWINCDCDWQVAMRLCLAILPMCERLFRQPDWKDSKGAIWECETAEKLGIKLHDL